MNRHGTESVQVKEFGIHTTWSQCHGSKPWTNDHMVALSVQKIIKQRFLAHGWTFRQIPPIRILSRQIANKINGLTGQITVTSQTNILTRLHTWRKVFIACLWAATLNPGTSWCPKYLKSKDTVLTPFLFWIKRKCSLHCTRSNSLAIWSLLEMVYPLGENSLSDLCVFSV